MPRLDMDNVGTLSIVTAILFKGYPSGFNLKRWPEDVYLKDCAERAKRILHASYETLEQEQEDDNR